MSSLNDGFGLQAGGGGGGTDLVLYKENPVSPTPNTVTGDNAVAIGSNCTSNSVCSFAQGRETTASGGYSFAEGKSTTASGNSSHAQNSSTIASGICSHAEGVSSIAAGDFSHAQNYSTTSDSYASTAIGRHNLGGGDANNWVATDPLFEIGNGTDSVNRNNALTVYKNGYIAPTIPSYANDAAADADTNLPSGGLYKLNAGRAIYQKP